MKEFVFSIGLGFSIGLCSCGTAPPAYIPNKMHTPLFDKQWEVAGEGSLTLTGANDFSAAVSVLPNAYLMGAISNRPKNYDSSGTGFSHNYFELGAGYFWKIKERGVFELCGTFGKGTVVSQGFNTIDKPFAWISFSDFGGPPETDTFMHVNAQYNRYSIEANFGAASIPLEQRLDTRFYVEAALCLRFSFLHFTRLIIQRDYSSDPIYNQTVPSNTRTWDTYQFFPEIGAMGRINFSAVAIEGHLGFTMAGNNSFEAKTYFATATAFFRL